MICDKDSDAKNSKAFFLSPLAFRSAVCVSEKTICSISEQNGSVY